MRFAVHIEERKNGGCKCQFKAPCINNTCVSTARVLGSVADFVGTPLPCPAGAWCRP